MTEIAGTAHIDDSKKNRHVVVEGVDENGAPAEKSYLIPVSYTHLDVYKRQTWTSARRWLCP